MKTSTKVFRAKAQRRKGKSLSLRLCGFASIFLLAACVLPVSFVHSQRELSGLAELKKGDYENAFNLLSARLVSNPNDTVAQRALLRVFLETGRYPEAEATAKRFLQKTPDTGGVRHELG